MRFRPAFALACAAGLAAAGLGRAQTPAAPQGAAEILQQWHAFRQTGTVLYVAAHPDDENTQLIAYFARGRGARTGYLSITRGEGGQNLIGGEFGDSLGVIRTQELLAARRIDGGRQFFTLARDFGYSKDYKQTLTRWDHAEVLADVVRVIRTFHPDILITRFPPQASETHGHHTASAVLAVEAFKLAGDPKAFPDKLAGLAPWQPRRVLWDAFRPGFRPGPPSPTTSARIDIGGYDAVLGQSFGEIAARSRSMHRTQVFGAVGNRGSREVYFELLAGEPAPRDPFDGIVTTWARYPGGDAIDRAAAEVERAFEPRHPEKSVPALLAIRDQLDRLPDAEKDPLIGDRRAQLERIVQSCLGLYVEAAANESEIVPGSAATVRRTVILRTPANVTWVDDDRGARPFGAASGRASDVNPRVTAIEPGPDRQEHSRVSHADTDAGGGLEHQGEQRSLTANGSRGAGKRRAGVESIGVTSDMAARLRENVAAVRQQQLPVPADADVTQPYWLREDEAPGMFHVAPRDTALIGSPENPPPLRVKEHFVVDGHDLWITSPVQRITAYPDRGEVRTDVHLVPSVSLSFPQPVALVAPGAGATITVRVTPNQGRAQGKLRLRAEGNAEPLVTVPFDVAGAAKTLQLHLPASDTGAGAHPGATLLSAEAVIDGRVWDTDRIVIRYPHIPDQLLQPRARMRLLTLDLKVTARRVGYVSGAGDSVADALTRMGCAVLPLRPDELTEDRLRGLDALVFGVRAFNTQAALPARLDAVFAYIAAGGTVVVQYNTPNELKTTRLGPYPLHLNRNLPHHRITDERSPITFLLPDSPALNVPNRIGPEDFQGWVQERGLNFPDAWDEHYQALLSSFDPGEAPQKSALLVAAYGKGHYVYTGLSFFRQLPAGVPGAYRLFANLISLGHD